MKYKKFASQKKAKEAYASQLITHITQLQIIYENTPIAQDPQEVIWLTSLLKRIRDAEVEYKHIIKQ